MRESDSVEQFITDSRKALEELKVKQLVGGKNVLHYFTGTQNAWDLFVYSDVPLKVYRITFSFETARNKALMGLTAFYRLNNPNVLVGPVEPTAVAPPINVYQDDVVPYSLDQYIIDLYIVNNSFVGIPTAYDVYIKYFFDGTDTGTFLTQQLS